MKNFQRLKKSFIIAEIGNNHEGNYQNAIKLIDKAKISGADAVKFQTFDTDYFINKLEKKKFKKLKNFELTQDQFRNLSIYTKKKGLKFISTPLDLGSAKFLSKIVDVFKIASGDNNFYELIEICASFKKPLIVSTGLLNLKEIKDLLKFLIKINFPKNKLAFLHCVSNYPVKDVDANLLSVKYLKELLPITIGYSDHTVGYESCLAAISLGAKIIEKHFTLKNDFSDFRDHKLSLNPSDMKKMIVSARRIENMIGNFGKKISKEEEKNFSSMRRSIYFKKKLNKGVILKRHHLKIVRPYNKINPNELSKVLGKKLKRDVESSQLVNIKNLK